MAWLRRAYGLFSRNYKKKIQKLYIIHPTTFTPAALSTEGLFRISGGEGTMRQLRHDLEAGQDVKWTACSVHDAAGVLKQFVRELRITAIPPSVTTA